MLLLCLATILVVICLGWWLTKRKGRNGYKALPGPLGIPLFGNVFQVGHLMHLQFGRWAKKYGQIYQIQLGNRKAIIISDTKMIKEIFSGDIAFTGRQIFEGVELYPNEPLGIISSEGELWQVHRKFLVRQLREFGFGKSSMEDMVMEEVNEVIQRLREFKGDPVDNVQDIVRLAVVNALWMIVGSTRFKHDDPIVLKMMHDTDQLICEMIKKAVTLFVPWTRFFMPKIKLLDEIRTNNRKFYGDIIEQHQKTLVQESPRDFIDTYLNEMEAQKDNPSSTFYGDKAIRQLQVILSDILFAGTDTTSTTISWALLYLAKFSNVREKLQQEIIEVVGNSRQVTLSDRINMPYTLAIMEETMRVSSITPNGIQHRAIVGKQFKDYFIEENTWIFPNIHHIHHDPGVWGDPENFRPERFLSKDGKTFQKNENMLPFVIGKRQCIGEFLARDSFFLFLTNIFQTFEVCLDESKPEPALEPQVGFILAPQPYTIQFKDWTKDDTN